MGLNAEQKERYLRHLMLEDVGEAGQEKLSQAKVLVIGAGGLGSPVLLYLAAAGIGNIGVLDFDKVDISNLQRQVIHRTQDINVPKVESAKAKMNALNPEVKVDTYQMKLDSKNALELFSKYDFIIDATDNFAGKFLINDASFLAKKPLSHAGVLKYRGQAMTILPGESACFACAFDAPPPVELNSYFKAGLFGVCPGILGCIQASEAIKYFLGIGDLLLNTLLTADLKSMEFRRVAVKKDPNCRVCGKEGLKELKDYQS
ncbi:hypothetical protein BKH43_01910 [Helicobacter sp. 13S00401-1]|uniref:HesA/MoeB/ThiF family protein n=1 Tax=Helicobacter sp. 13S00401-1 TaxID=1905758 RepID=UPI000BA63832|nr:HesA/MoeB/ThiF family protein [Helicobacter sp. 13S00401-1]PAF51418.1 hypothetical protein BKH43_01910 [Helicobacter sp. 13S00401-1]